MNENENLADLGGWPKAKLGAHSVIKHAYDNAISASARLYSFASGESPKTDGPIGEQQEILATDDLLAFAIHSRRLIENTISIQRARQTLVPVAVTGSRQHISITRIINVLVHHKKILVIRSEKHLKIHFRAASLHDLLHDDDHKISPICIVTSDKDVALIFKIQEMIEIYQEKVISPIIDLCDEHHLFLTAE